MTEPTTRKRDNLWHPLGRRTVVPVVLALAVAAFGCTQKTPTPTAATRSFLSESITRDVDGWSCEWLDAPMNVADTDGQCTGVVSCRHQTMLFFMPQIHEISCPASKGACDPTKCFLETYLKRGPQHSP